MAKMGVPSRILRIVLSFTQRVVRGGKIFIKKTLRNRSLYCIVTCSIWLFFRNELVCEEQMELVAFDEVGKIMPKAVALSSLLLILR